MKRSSPLKLIVLPRSLPNEYFNLYFYANSVFNTISKIPFHTHSINNDLIFRKLHVNSKVFLNCYLLNHE